MSNYSLDSNNIAHTFIERMVTPMHNLAFSGVLNPAQKPPFPPAAKSMRGAHLRFDVSALIIAGVSTGEER